MIGHKVIGRGPEKVLMMHDWFCDSTSYDFTQLLWDLDNFTFCFMDLRGYGKSINMEGECTADEAVHDVLALADHLKWDRFHLVGHSMSGLVAQKVAVEHRARLKSVIATTPVPACGSPVPDDVLGFLEDAADRNDESALAIVDMMTGARLSDGWKQFKVDRWRRTSQSQARIAYLHMFAQTDFSNQIQNNDVPLLVIVGEYDAEGHREEVMQATILKWFPQSTMKVCPNSGHYPMQEAPAYFVKMVEEYVASKAG